MVGGDYVASHSRAPLCVIQISPGARTVSTVLAARTKDSTFAQNLLTSQSHHVTFPHLDAPSLVAQSPFAMLSLSRVARASATGRAAAASVSATRSYHKNVRVTRPPRLGTFSHLLRARARALQ